MDHRKHARYVWTCPVCFREAAEFFDSCRAYTERNHPAAIGQYMTVFTNADAARARYADGRRIYKAGADAGWSNSTR